MIKSNNSFIKIEKEFQYNTDLTTSNITEAFGIGTGYTKKICSISIPTNFQILYITGESGSGKTSILKELAPNYTEEKIIYDKTLSHWLGDAPEDEERAIYFLSLCGLSDATMFISKYNFLSDSEKARARMFLELSSNKELIVIDEFLSTLDRKTAKSLAYCFQKAIRKLGKKLIVATAHNDLYEYLKPDVIITGKAYPSSFVVKTLSHNENNPFTEKTTLQYVNKQAYKELKLGELHYKGKYTGGTKEYLFAYYEGETVGCLVSIYNMSTKGRRISRVIVHPSYRSIGIGQMLIKKYIEDFPNTDVIASMALYNKVFEKSGMIRIEDSIIKSPKGLKNKLLKFGFESNKWHDRIYCLTFCNDKNVRNIISEYADKCTQLVKPGGQIISIEEIKELIKNDTQTCGRVLYQLRDRRMAKYVTEFVYNYMKNKT